MTTCKSFFWNVWSTHALLQHAVEMCHSHASLLSEIDQDTLLRQTQRAHLLRYVF